MANKDNNNGDLPPVYPGRIPGDWNHIEEDGETAATPNSQNRRRKDSVLETSSGSEGEELLPQQQNRKISVASRQHDRVTPLRKSKCYYHYFKLGTISSLFPFLNFAIKLF